MKLRLLSTAAVCVSLVTPLAAQEMISPFDPQDIVNAVQDLGYRAVLKTDSLGDPMISSSAAGLNYIILFYGCTDNIECVSVQFSAAFTLDPADELPDLNAWNADKRYTKAHLDDDGDIILKLDINMEGAGISQGAFEGNLDNWESLLNDFKLLINW